MPSPVRPRLALAGAFLALAALPLLAGCGGSGSMLPVVIEPKLPVGTPAANAPDSTAWRFLMAYTVGVESEAGALLTGDYHYHFSPQTDPALVSLYGYGWGKPKETASLHHQWHGFTNGQGEYIPPVSAMSFGLTSPVVIDDTTHADSTAYYKVVTAAVLSLDIDVSTSGGTITYNIRAPFQFRMVRGDAAVLGTGQSASPARWYLREIDDLSPATAAIRRAPGSATTNGAQSSTWGAVRALYAS